MNKMDTNILCKWPFQKLRDEAINEAVEYIKNIKGKKPIVTGDGWWIEAINHINKKGLCLEFGVWEGESINYFSSAMPERHLHGFDSFEGLQEDWQGGIHGIKWFNQNGILPHTNENVTLHKGWFKNVLPNFFKKNKDKIAFMHVDCDTYESSNDVFNNIPIDKIQKGTVLLLDDYISYWGWKENLYKSFQEWIKKNKLKYEYQVFGVRSAQVVII
jgi:hypothetical protein